MIGFKGAGLVLIRMVGNEKMVLLGRRRYNPGAGLWTFPGGHLDREDDGDYLVCGAREFREETSLLSRKDENNAARVVGEFRYHLPFFRWSAFFVESDHPYKLGRGHSAELSEYRFFKFDDLPRNLHFGVREALAKYESLTEKTSGKLPVQKKSFYEQLRALDRPVREVKPRRVNRPRQLTLGYSENDAVVVPGAGLPSRERLLSLPDGVYNMVAASGMFRLVRKTGDRFTVGSLPARGVDWIMQNYVKVMGRVEDYAELMGAM